MFRHFYWRYRRGADPVRPDGMLPAARQAGPGKEDARDPGAHVQPKGQSLFLPL